METNSTYYIDLIIRYLFGEATPEQILELEAWIIKDPANGDLFSEYQKTWKTLENDRIKASVDIDHEWKKLVSKLEIETEDHQKATPRIQSIRNVIGNQQSAFVYWSLRIAAIFLLIAVPSYFLYRYFIVHQDKQLTATTEMIEQILPDGTIVTLNTGATLLYPGDFEGSFRKVTLQGEAWFEVAHDQTKPFIVSAGNASIRVVGTSFYVNTKSFDDMKEVILSSGIVRVYFDSKPGNTVFLFPGDKAELSSDDHTIIKTDNDDMNFLSWKTKRMIFNNAPLNEVVALLTKVYHTSVRLSDDRMSDCRITTTFDRQSLESVLNVLKATLDLQVRNTGAGIELSGNGCNQPK